MGFIINNVNLRILSILFLLLFLSACSQSADSINYSSASPSQTKKVESANFENLNRKIFRFNVGLDTFLLKPAAKAYKAVTPGFVEVSVSNFFQNLADVGNAFNNLLQAKPMKAVNDTERFIINSTLGLAGILDIASEAGLEKHHEDFGQTLASWGVGSGPYVMLPFFGPSTVRDATAKLSMDILTQPTFYHDEALTFFAVRTLDQRADLLSQEEALKDLSDDSYKALRDVWLQRREYLIRDGKIDQKEQSDLIDELESLELE